MIKLIILDRDGVINFDSPEYIKTPDEWQPIPGSLEAIARLNAHGYKVAVATNQSGIGRGYYTLETLHAIHGKMEKSLAALGGHFDALAFCPHHPNDHCPCRKPQPGLLKQISQLLNIDLKDALMIGDSARDMQAAAAAGAQGIFIHPARKIYLPTIPVFANLAEAVNILLQNSHA